MNEMKIRLYHCHKLRKNVHIFEEYKVIDGRQTLVHCSCPEYEGTTVGGRKCDGLNDFGSPCGHTLFP